MNLQRKSYNLHVVYHTLHVHVCTCMYNFILAVGGSGCMLHVAPLLSGVAVQTSAAAVAVVAVQYWPMCPCASEVHLLSFAILLPLPAIDVCIDPPCLQSWCELPHDLSSLTQNPLYMSQPVDTSTQ